MTLRGAAYVEGLNPMDFTESDLSEVAAAIRRAAPALEVHTHTRLERGSGVNLAEILKVYLEAGEFAGAGASLAAPLFGVTAWFKKRRAAELAAHPEREPRDKIVVILGPDGEPIKAVQVEGSSASEVDLSFDRKHRYLPWPPGR
ncbi:MAG: hypothetical protein REI11_04620 [Patulibacter sp.]|nr:hypothetical protein [Patulibacter sp.]